MVTQGSVQESVDDQFETLAGFTKVIKPELVAQVLEQSGKQQTRKSVLNFERTLWTVLAMGVFTDLPIRDVFRFMHVPNGEKLPGRSALCRARKRLGSEPLRRLHETATRRIGNPDSPSCCYMSLRLVGIDGCIFNTPDTPANEIAFGRPKGGNDSDSQGAFPQVGKLSLVELGTHVELAVHLRAQRQGEQTIAYRLTKHLKPGDLLLMDAGIYCFRMAKQVKDARAEFLARSPVRTLKPDETLSDGSYLATVYPHRNHRSNHRNGLAVRVIEYTLNDPLRTGFNKKHRIITSLLDADKHPAKELVSLYHERWEQEIVFDEQKTHQDPRRAHKPTHLRSQTPAGIAQELYALSLAHFVVRKLMHDASEIDHIDVDRISFVGAFRILRYRLASCHAESLGVWYEQLTREVAQEVIPPRRNRINPRVLRQSRSKWKTKAKNHFKPPQPTQPFKESIVMAT